MSTETEKQDAPKMLAHPHAIQAAQAALKTQSDLERIANAEPIRPTVNANVTTGDAWIYQDGARRPIKQEQKHVHSPEAEYETLRHESRPEVVRSKPHIEETKKRRSA